MVTATLLGAKHRAASQIMCSIKEFKVDGVERMCLGRQV